MFSYRNSTGFLICQLFLSVESLSISRLTFCPFASWQTNGTIIIDNRTLGLDPQGFFIGKTDQIYVVDSTHHRVLIYTQNPLILLFNITHGLVSPKSIFVTKNDDIFIDNGFVNGRVEKYSSSNKTIGVPVMLINGSCYSLFVDSNDVLYCSLTDSHLIHKIALNSSHPNETIVVAGTGVCGFTSQSLCFPRGIFVDSNSDLYVADTSNNRIQWFPFGQLNGTTIVGNVSSLSSIVLHRPTSIFIDDSRYIYIVDSENRRILRSTSTDFDCIIGCNVSSARLSPINFGFGTRGNIFILDEQNQRIQQFLLIRNSCISYNRPQLCHNATWNSTATTYLTRATLKTPPRGIFIDLNDIFYWTQSSGRQMSFLALGNPINTSLSITTRNQSFYASPFLSTENEIYFVTDSPPGVLMKRSTNGTILDTRIRFNRTCHGLFIDTNNSLYCSLNNENRVARVFLNINSNNTKELSIDATFGPWGLFVDTNFDVYVCEASRNRVRRFRTGQNNGTLVAGEGYPNGLRLKYPTDVILDTNSYLYIADNSNHRIIRVWSTGYQCIAGCSCMNGTRNDQMTKPIALRFDSYGNLYVADEFNQRVQKFTLISKCDQNGTTLEPTTCPSAIVTTFQTTSAEITSTNVVQSSSSSSPSFQLRSCSNSSHIGSFCNESAAHCDILKPCLNNGSCLNVPTNQRGFQCLCPQNFTGDLCQTSLASLETCRSGWKGKQCNERINYCKNITCENEGVCRSFSSYYRCECLVETYSGQFCEIVATKIVFLRRFSRSVCYISIIIISFCATFIVTMDVLKYFFGIDITNIERLELRQKKKNKPKFRHGRQKR